MPFAPPPVFDETAAHPDVRLVKAGLAAKDWAAVTEAVERHRGAARTRLLTMRPIRRSGVPGCLPRGG